MCFNLTLTYCIPFPWHEMHHCNRQAVHVLQIRISAVNPLCEHPNIPEWQWALSAAAQLAPNPSRFFSPRWCWCSQTHFYSRWSWTQSMTDWQKVLYCSPKPKFSTLTTSIPRKGVYRHRDGERPSIHHIPQHNPGLTESILDTFRACFVINFCKWIIDSLSWIRAIW